MSVQAMAWVLEEAPDLPAHLFGTLLALANHADRDGRGSYPSQPTLAWYTRKTDRAIRNDLIQLAKLGLIREGDQRLTAHIPADERPVVYDLATELKRDPRAARDRKPTSGRKTRGTGSGLPPLSEKGPEVGFQRDRKWASAKPSLEPSTSSSSAPSTAVGRIAEALNTEEEEAQKVFDRIVAERRPVAPSRYVQALIDSGDIQNFRKTAPTVPAYTGARCEYRAAPDGTGRCDRCDMPRAHARHGAAA